MVWKSRGSYGEARAGAFLETGIGSRINKEIADQCGWWEGLAPKGHLYRAFTVAIEGTQRKTGQGRICVQW